MEYLKYGAAEVFEVSKKIQEIKQEIYKVPGRAGNQHYFREYFPINKLQNMTMKSDNNFTIVSTKGLYFETKKLNGLCHMTIYGYISDKHGSEKVELHNMSAANDYNIRSEVGAEINSFLKDLIRITNKHYEDLQLAPASKRNRLINSIRGE